MKEENIKGEYQRKVDNCILKKEYRYCYDRDLIEVPAGTFEEDETDGLAVAKRELLEETGYESDEWQYLGATVESSAKLTNYMHIYFANHCKKVSEQHLDATEDVEKTGTILVKNQYCASFIFYMPFFSCLKSFTMVSVTEKYGDKVIITENRYIIHKERLGTIYEKSSYYRYYRTGRFLFSRIFIREGI